MAVAAQPGASSNAEIGDKGLKSNAIGYLSNLVIGVASTAPAYSLAATLGVAQDLVGNGDLLEASLGLGVTALGRGSGWVGVVPRVGFVGRRVAERPCQ